MELRDIRKEIEFRNSNQLSIDVAFENVFLEFLFLTKILTFNPNFVPFMSMMNDSIS